MFSALAADEIIVADSSSLLAYLRGEPGGELVQKVFRHALECGYKVQTTALTLLEVYNAVASEKRSLMDDVISLVGQLPLRILPLTEECAAGAARKAAATGGVTPEQCCALELATDQNATLLTADGSLAERFAKSLLVSSRYP